MNFRRIFQKIRIFQYKLLSNCGKVIGRPKLNQPTQLLGDGTIVFGNNVNLGYFPSPFFYNSYIYVDARSKGSRIVFGDNVHVNNNCVFIAEGEGIEIGSDTLIGSCCEIIDSDFHDLHPDRRMSGKAKTAKVEIGRNVFIGNNVKIMKGVTIGDNCVIANGSIVAKSIPDSVIAGGNPAKVIKQNEF